MLKRTTHTTEEQHLLTLVQRLEALSHEMNVLTKRQNLSKSRSQPRQTKNVFSHKPLLLKRPPTEGELPKVRLATEEELKRAQTEILWQGLRQHFRRRW